MRFPTIRDYADGFLRLKLNGVEWLGVRIVDQDEANDQISKLLRTEAAKRFVVYNPSGPVDFTAWFEAYQCDGSCDRDDCKGPGPGIDWLIVGGESGPGARPCDVAWIRSAVEQCLDAGVPVFVKQLGSRPLARSVDDFGPDIFRGWDSEHANEPVPISGVEFRWRSRKGNDPSEWPEDLMVREVPT